MQPQRCATIPLRGFTICFKKRFSIRSFPKHKTKVCTQFCIDTDYMEKHPAYFGEEIQLCKEFGIYDYIGLQQNFNEHLVMQFFATVHFFPDEPRRIKWMSKDEVLEVTWSEFATLLGLAENGFELDEIAQQQFFHINYNTHPMNPNALYELYIPRRALVGFQKNLLKFCNIMHCIFRNTVAPQVGNFDQIQGK